MANYYQHPYRGMRNMKRESRFVETLVIALIVAGFFYAAQQFRQLVTVDLSPINQAAAVFGAQEVKRPPRVGYDPAMEKRWAGTAVASAAGAGSAVEVAGVQAPDPAPFCAAGQVPEFVMGFATLRAQVGAAMGQPVDCEHPNPENGDSLQTTTTGLAIYERATGVMRFTDGYRHWALTSDGLVAWEGDAPPPELAQNPGREAAQ